MKEILKTVSEKTGVPENDILSKRRKHDVTEARRIFIHMAFKTGRKNSEIACFLGKSHSDVTQQRKVIQNEMNIYRYLNEKIKSIETAGCSSD